MSRTMLTNVWRGTSMSVVLCLNSSEFVNDQDWADHMAIMRACVTEDPRLERVRGLAISDGGSPTARQRRELVALIRGTQSVGAIVTSSRLVRGVGTFLGWFMPAIRTYAPVEFPRARQHLGVSNDDEPAFWSAIAEMNRTMRLEIVDELVRFEGES